MDPLPGTPPPLDAEGRLDLPAALAAVRRARARCEAVRETPTVYSYTFSESSGSRVWLKLENLQRTGSFKLRGALNKVLSLTPQERARGLAAASAGNHAQGVALAAKLEGLTATIVMPESTAVVKVRRTEHYGAEVRLVGRNYDEAQRHARELAEREGRTLIHPFDDFDVIAGQGTVGLELLEQVPELEAVVVPVGGGGLIAGVAVALKALRPEVRVIGVQAVGAAPMVASWRAGEQRSIEDPRTIAEGIRVGSTGAHTWSVVRELVDEMVTVDEEEIVDAMVVALQMSKVVPEAAGAAAIAAVAAGRVRSDGELCAVVSGGNIDLSLLGRLIESGLARQGFYHPLRVRVADLPGELHRVVEALAETRCNILDVQHLRSGWRVPVGCVDLEILVETRSDFPGPAIEAFLVERGLELVAPT